MRYDAIIFDKDGVLIDTEPYYAARRHAFFAEAGIDDSGFPDFYGSNNKVIWETAVPDDPDRRRELFDRFCERFKDDPIPFARLAVPGVREVLAGCRARGCAVGLASSAPRWGIQAFLDALDLGGFFDAVLSGEECPAPKPAPDVYLEAMARLGVPAEKTLVVEDSPLGIRAAHDAGATVCAVTPPSCPDLDQSLADVRISRLRDLPALLDAGDHFCR